MTRYDSEHETTTESKGRMALKGAGRLVERNMLAAKLAAFYAAAFGVSLLARHLAKTPNLDEIASIAVWFTIIFAVCTAILGTIVKAFDFVQRRRHDFE